MSDAPVPKKTFELWSDEEWAHFQQQKKPMGQQIKEVFSNDPGIPIFVGATVGVLATGMYKSFVVNDPVQANKYMFARVFFQGCAAVAIGYSIFRHFGSGDDKPVQPSRFIDQLPPEHRKF